MIKESWAPINGYPNYQISDLGNIRSRHGRLENGIIKTRLNRGGYAIVNLSNNTMRKTYRVHQLVSLSFIGKLEPGMMIDHINGIKTDNRLCNLRHCTPQQNYANQSKPNVYHDKKSGKYRAQIKVNWKLIYLGTFATREEAVAKWVSEKTKLFGQYSSAAVFHNTPAPGSPQ